MHKASVLVLLFVGLANAEESSPWRVAGVGAAIALEYEAQRVATVSGILITSKQGAGSNLLSQPFQALAAKTDAGGIEQAFVAPGPEAAPRQFTVSVKPRQDSVALVVKTESAEPCRIVAELEVVWGQDPWLCRMAPAANPDVVQTAFGELAENAHCDAVFDRFADRILRAVAQKVVWRKDGKQLKLQIEGQTGDTLTLVAVPSYYRDKLGVRFYAPIDTRIKRYFPLPLSGWCSWYEFYQHVDQEKILANAQVVAKYLKPCGAEFVQIDDGWQGVGLGGGENRDWLTVAKKFPLGMPALAAEIHKLGLKASLWVIPQTQSNREFVNANREAFVWGHDGKSPFCTQAPNGAFKQAEWPGAFLVDPTSPKGLEVIRGLMHKLAREWGYDYFKIDGQTCLIDWYKQHRKLLRDPKVEPAAAYRRSLETIREAIGPERFLLGCWGTPMDGIGLLDGSRTGGDVSASWGGFQGAIGCTMGSYFLHNVVWYCDPDVLLVRPPLTLDQARAWATLFAITGQHLMASDDLTRLPRERLQMLQRVFPALNIRPVDLYSHKGKPRIWDLKVSLPDEEFDVVAVFNREERPARIPIALKDLGIVAKDGDEYDVMESWTWEYLGRITAEFTARLPATCARVYVVKQCLDHPRVLATYRHLIPGAGDKVVVSWDEKIKVLAGTCPVVYGLPTAIAIACPSETETPGELRVELNGQAVDPDEFEVSSDGPLLSVINQGWPRENGTLKWAIGFSGKGAASVAR